MKIYTKTGDSGTTSLFGGKRVQKDSARIQAYGEVDELNSQIGVILADFEGVQPLIGVGPLKRKLLRIQSELFVLGADLATPNEVSTSLSTPLKLRGSRKLRGASKVPRVKKSMITRLEKEIDKWSTSLPQLRNFILPGGGKIGSKLHLTRTVARRAERSLVALSKEETINKNAQIYINRLSDWFFVMARHVNKLENIFEKVWKGRVKI